MLLVPEAGARYHIHLMYLQQVIGHGWAGFGNEDTTWGDKPGACARLTVAELATNGVQCRPWKSFTIYLSDQRQERNDRLMSVHTSGEIGDIQLKNPRFSKEIAGL